MAFTFRPAVRESVSLLVGLSGGTGSGKTYSAMRLAHGIAGDQPFAVIDTEAGRAQHYADAFRFDHGDLHPPFTPAAYADAIAAADAAKYPVIVVDSMSHEWAGEGGILDWQELELQRMAGDDWKRREACKMAAWIKPKMAHKQMVQRLLQIRAHLVLCFRAEPKVEMVRGADGKMEIREKQSLTGLHGWIPVAEKNLPYELTASFLLMADRPGIPLPIKLQAQHRDLFPLDRPITEDAGARLAAWASGGMPAAPDRLAADVRAIDADLARLRALEQIPAPAMDWLAKIYTARTIDELKGVSRDLKASAATLAPDRLLALRTAYDTHRKELEARRASASTAPHGDVAATLEPASAGAGRPVRPGRRSAAR